MTQAEVESKMLAHIAAISARGNNYWWHVHRYTLVCRELATNTQRHLDYGCGDGGFLRWLQHNKNIPKLYGFDANAGVRELLQQNHRSQITILNTFPAPNLNFDSMTVLDVLEHIDDDDGCLAELFAGLSADGTLAITVPAGQFLWSDWDRRLGHYRRYSKKVLIKKLNKAGFEVKKATYFFSYLCGPVFMRKILMRRPVVDSDRDLEFVPVSPFINKVLLLLGQTENALLKYMEIPFGTSLLVIAKKPK